MKKIKDTNMLHHTALHDEIRTCRISL